MRFFLIDRITRWEVDVAAEATKNIALSEDFFDDHFPRRPVMPGVLILEGMAQLSGLLLESSLMQKCGKSAKAVLTVLERTKFRALVKPGETLLYRAEVLSVNEAGGKVKVTARRDGLVVTSTEMTFAFKYVADPQLDEKRRRLMEVWMTPGTSVSLPPESPASSRACPAPGAPASSPANPKQGRHAGRDAGGPAIGKEAGEDVGAPGENAGAPGS